MTRTASLLILLILALVVLGQRHAQATMPLLTEEPRPPSLAGCLKWAEGQNEDALEMWGIQDSGKASRDIAVLRLALSCLGDKKPEIVGFGSSIGFDLVYCRKHRTVPICKNVR